MEAAARAERAGGGLPAWALGLIPLALIAAAIGAFALLGGPGLGERTGPPVEELSVERTVLKPGTIELTLRNDGPDPVEIAQVAVNDGFAPFSTDGGREIGRLASTTLHVSYPWIEGEAYEIFILTSSGGTVDAEIPVATETPAADLDFYGLMALLGIYVGVIPVCLGMLWLPFVRRIDARWIAGLLAFTVGLLAFLAIDAGLEGLEIAAEAPAAFGGASLVFAGALIAYLLLAAVDAYLRRRGELSSGTG
ncbi:MAG: ZIP family metal transporter, partial [Solirubrobacterales bacterium]